MQATFTIGLHLAGRLHQLGNQVVACGRELQQLDNVATHLSYVEKLRK